MSMMGDSNRDRRQPAQSRGTGTVQGVRRVSATALFAGGRELIIEHGSEEYRLRVTSKGKLILTK